MKLSDQQQQTVAVALTVLAALVIATAVAAVGWLLVLFLRTFANVFLPVAVAGILALVCQPYYYWLRYKKRIPVYASVVILIVSILLPFIGFCVFFGVILIEQFSDFVVTLPKLWEKASAAIVESVPQAWETLQNSAVGEHLSEVMQQAGGLVGQGLEMFATTALAAGSGFVHWVGGLLGWAVTPVYFVFFLTAKRRKESPLAEYLPFLKQETREDVQFLAHEFVSILVTFFRGQLIIAFLQGILFAIGFSIVGLKYGLLLGLLLGFLNIIPYLGSMVGLAATLPLAYLQDGGGLGLLASVIGVLMIVQTIEGYLLTPRIMGDRTGLHPMAIIVAIFFWGTALNGVLGMILAIPLTAFLVVFWRLARKKYIHEWL